MSAAAESPKPLRSDELKKRRETHQRTYTRALTEAGRYAEQGRDDALDDAAERAAKAKSRIEIIGAEIARAEKREADAAAKSKADAARKAAAEARAELTENEREAIRAVEIVTELGQILNRMEGRAVKAINLLPSHWADPSNVYAHRSRYLDMLLATRVTALAHLWPGATDKDRYQFDYPAFLAERFDAVMLNVPGAERARPAPEAPCRWEDRPGAPLPEEPQKPPRPFADERERAADEAAAQARQARIDRADRFATTEDTP